MYRAQLIDRVRELLRDDRMSKTTIRNALNRVIREINAAGRFRFHQATEDITLVTSTFQYAVTATILSEQFLVFQPQTTDMAIVKKWKGGIAEAIDGGAFGTDTGDAPTTYLRHGGFWWLDPIPNATANGKTVRIYHEKDITPMTSDLDSPGSLPARYQETLLVWGAVGDIDPNATIRQGADSRKATDAYREAFTSMVRQEKWERLEGHQMLADDRFEGMEDWGDPR